jgi:hypothetical protein
LASNSWLSCTNGVFPWGNYINAIYSTIGDFK